MLGDQFKIEDHVYLDAFRKVARELETTGGDIAELGLQLYDLDGSPRDQHKGPAQGCRRALRAVRGGLEPL